MRIPDPRYIQVHYTNDQNAILSSFFEARWHTLFAVSASSLRSYVLNLEHGFPFLSDRTPNTSLCKPPFNSVSPTAKAINN